ncbi:dipicolinate synthase subunit DpsA [Salsuginibacillus kocurii]|uniref:dipicolinate synthase subunit DpsA n=1 Tax=Salsuginibacillus kocurii TaxID=427078 RepID=UPI00037A1AF0|nr:dipicolinate synthase subunit DpsA [Salsuginibacillus kocurii]
MRSIAIIGGDARQIEMMRTFADENIRTYALGFDHVQLHHGLKATFQEVPWQQIEALLFPVSGIKEQDTVEAVFSSQPLVIDREQLQKTSSACKWYTGIKGTGGKALEKGMKRKLHPLLERDDVAILNGIPTAEGIVYLLIKHTDITIHGADIVVLGAGRVGLTVANTLQAMGAHVTSISNDPYERARLKTMQIKNGPLEKLPDMMPSADMVVNTIPALVLTKSLLREAKPQLFILDVASGEGGTDFEYAKERGLKAMLAPGLPGWLAPKRAGQMLAETVLFDLNQL